MRTHHLFVAWLALSLAACGGPRQVVPISATSLADAAPESSPDEGNAALIPGSESPGCGLGRGAEDSIGQIGLGDEVRSYRLHLPPAYDGARSLPLVINYHGYGRSAYEQESYSGLVPLADRESFILVSPEGSGSPQAWDIVGVYAENGFDDVGFSAALVYQLEADLCVDSNRIYATGLSNGAEMASEVACYLPGLFAAVAPVAGIVYQDCGGSPVPIVTFHGTDDYNVPFEFAPPAVADWAAHNGCDPGAITEQVTDHVSRITYPGCGRADVVFYVVDGGGHTWPGADDDTGGVGPTTHEISASEIMWEFFAAHPRPD